MTVWVGFTQTAIPYKRDPRYAGETKYPVRKMLRFSLDAIASFSHLPLQIATYLGFLFAGVAFIAIPVVIILHFTGGYLPGFGSITITILMIGGLQLIALGLIGEYVGRIYDESSVARSTSCATSATSRSHQATSCTTRSCRIQPRAASCRSVDSGESQRTGAARDRPPPHPR